MSINPAFPLYGRKYQLTLKLPDSQGNQTVLDISDSSFEPGALRITFDVTTVAWQTYWSADIVIYNLDEPTGTQILSSQGMEVSLSAGYQNSGYGVIWDGYVMQALWDRENVVDFKITLHCMIGFDDLTRNFINRTYAGISQQQLITRMAKDCFRPIGVQSISTKLDAQVLPRGKTVFGNPKKYIDWVAADNNMMSWLTSKGLNMTTPAAALPGGTATVYTPATGLIGTPEQTDQGVMFRVLLDSSIQIKNPLMQVKIDNTIIRQQKRNIGELPHFLDSDGQYIVTMARYVGDSRGNDWYTEVTGVTQEWALLLNHGISMRAGL